MVKKIVLLGLLAAAFYVHARVSFGDARVMSWLAGHTARAMSGEREACDDFTDDVEVTLLAQGRRGHWEVEGGKDEICGYYKQGSAALTVLQASTNTQFDDLTVVRSSFPWRSATVSFVSRTSVNVRGAPPTTIESEDTVTLVRTLSGIKIKSLESRSTGGL